MVDVGYNAWDTYMAFVAVSLDEWASKNAEVIMSVTGRIKRGCKDARQCAAPAETEL